VRYAAALILFGAVLGLAVVEVALRVVGFDDPSLKQAQQFRWIPHPFLPYAGRPLGNFTHRNQRYPEVEHIEHNSYGFRTHEFPARKDPGDLVVVCFGESTTYGTTASNEQTWPARLERILAAHWPQRRVRVYNLGLDMATTTVSVVNLGLIGVHLRPDIVVVYHGNDLLVTGSPDFRTDHSHFFRDIDVGDPLFGMPAWLSWSHAARYSFGKAGSTFSGNDLLSVATKQGSVHMGQLMSDGPGRYHGIEATLENLRTIHSIVAGAGGHVLFSTYHVRDPNPAVTHYNERLRSFFDENDFAYVDQEGLIPDNDLTLNFDFCHFTEKGDEMMARNFAEAIIGYGWVAASPVTGTSGG
jgi:lysophospholipase L1-like esterase